MPSVSKFTTFDVDLYELDLINSLDVKHILTMNGIRTSFDSPGAGLAQITMYGAQIQSGLAVVDYSEETKKAKIIYIKGGNGMLESPAEVGPLYEKGLGQKLAGLLPDRKAARLFIVSSLVMYDGTKLVKLVLTDALIDISAS
jgi:hypothetical protein